MNRQEWAWLRRERYVEWAGQIAESPWRPVDMAEFAILSAHTPMALAIKGWLLTRRMVTSRRALGEALRYAGVMAPYRKAEYIVALRQRHDVNKLATLPQFITRRHLKIWGLGPAKLSFAMALCRPLDGDVACIDVHVAAELGLSWTTAPNLAGYEAAESILREEASDVGLPLFAYQWAVWDYARWWRRGLPPFDHSFLWRSGQTTWQMPLGLEGRP